MLALQNVAKTKSPQASVQLITYYVKGDRLLAGALGKSCNITM